MDNEAVCEIGNSPRFEALHRAAFNRPTSTTLENRLEETGQDIVLRNFAPVLFPTHYTTIMSCSQCSCSQCASFRGSSSTCLDYCTDVETKGSNHENRSTLKRDRSPSTERGDTTESDSEDRFRLKRARPLPTGAADVQDSLKISNLIIHTEGVNIIQPAQFAFAVYKFGFIDKDE